MHGEDKSVPEGLTMALTRILQRLVLRPVACSLGALLGLDSRLRGMYSSPCNHDSMTKGE